MFSALKAVVFNHNPSLHIRLSRSRMWILASSCSEDASDHLLKLEHWISVRSQVNALPTGRWCTGVYLIPFYDFDVGGGIFETLIRHASSSPQPSTPLSIFRVVFILTNWTCELARRC